MATQLAAAQEREAEACRDAEEIHGMFEDLKARSKLEEEEAARILKERDELLEKDAQASRRAVEAQNELETERNLRRKAKSEAVALQKMVVEDAVLIDRLRGEQDEAR